LNDIYDLKILLLLEKLFIIKKELTNLKEISYFFSCNTENRSSCQTFYDLHEDIKTTIQDVIQLIQDVNSLNQKNFKEPISFFIQVDCFNKTIEKLLTSIILLSDKLFQMKKENFPDYDPSPLIGKRYSSKGFVDYLDRDYNNLIQAFNNENWHRISHANDCKQMKKAMVFHWAYSDMYYVPQFHNSTDTNTERLKHIKLAYWNHDIPVLIPAITHEVGHVLINNNLIFNKYINSRFNHIKDTYLNTILSKHSPKKLLEEFSADLFAFAIHKESYIFTLFYVIYGKDFCTTFTKDGIEILPALNFTPKRDYSIVRIAALIEIYLHSDWSENDKSKTFISHIKSIQKAINYIYPFWDNLNIHGNTLFNIFSEYWNEREDFKNLTTIVNDLKDLLIHGNIDHGGSDLYSYVIRNLKLINNYVTNESNNNSLFGGNKSIPTLWRDRLENPLDIRHKKFFRESLMNIDTIEFLGAYELNFHKIHMTNGSNETDSRGNTSKDYFESIIETFNCQTNENPFYNQDSFDFTCSILGSYHIVSLNKKTDNVKINNAVNYLHNQSCSNTNYHFFTRKQSLLEIKINSSMTLNQENFLNNLGFIVQIQLFQNNNKELANLVKEVETHFQEYLGKFRLFKSLGPCEGVMIFHDINLEDAFKIKTIFSSHISSSRRTSSSIFFNKFNTNITSSEKHYLTSEIRLSATRNDSLNKKELVMTYLKQNYAKVKDLIEIPGERDLRIYWEDGIPLNELNLFYHQIKNDESATDVQSNFNLSLKEVLED